MARKARYLALGAALLVVGCSLLNPLDGYTGGVVGPDGSTVGPVADVGTMDTSTASDAGDAGDAGCANARPPSRPQPSPSTDGGSTTVVAAIASFDLADKNDAKRPSRAGYDLDQLCTCPGLRACVPKSGGGICDLPLGVDNAGGDWLLGLSNAVGNGGIGGGVLTGADGLLIRIRNYNDELDDDLVEVAFFDTFGFEGLQPDAGASAGALKRDGTDRWTVDAKSLIGGTPYLPVAADNRAYVRGGVVVAELRFPLRIGTFTFPIAAGYMTAKLVKKPVGYALVDGIFSSRLNASDFLTSFENVPSGLPGPGFVCGSDPYYASLRDTLCRVLDLPTDPNTDGRETSCDAVSLILNFTADPAVLGDVISRPPRVRPCGDTWVGKCL